MVIMVWVKLMDPLQAVFQDFFLLVKMIALMIGKHIQKHLLAFGWRLGTNCLDSQYIPACVCIYIHVFYVQDSPSGGVIESAAVSEGVVQEKQNGVELFLGYMVHEFRFFLVLLLLSGTSQEARAWTINPVCIVGTIVGGNDKLAYPFFCGSQVPL